MMTTPSLPNDALSGRIEQLMLELHIPAHLMGFRYLARSIYLVYCDASLLSNVVDNLYRIAAEDFGTIRSRFERDIRTALKKVPHIDYDVVFGFSTGHKKQHITPKEFIALCVNKLHMEDASTAKTE